MAEEMIRPIYPIPAPPLPLRDPVYKPLVEFGDHILKRKTQDSIKTQFGELKDSVLMHDHYDEILDRIRRLENTIGLGI